jgi:biopolymer transport protein ExbB
MRFHYFCVQSFNVTQQKTPMKKVFATALLVSFAFQTPVFAQDAAAAPAATEAAAEATDTATAVAEETAEPAAAVQEEASFTQVFKKKFIEGDPIWMAPVLIILIIGLAVVIERLLYLTFAANNNTKLLNDVEAALNNGGIDAAMNVAYNNRGPVATLIYQGLAHYGEGMDMVDKSVLAVGSVENGKLERNITWIALFIALAPMLGFLGTVIGMIQAFDAIEAAGDISPSLVAGGIKVALLTTVFGLIVAMILQVFYNLILSMVDGIVNKMEDASISFLDMMVAFDKKNK